MCVEARQYFIVEMFTEASKVIGFPPEIDLQA
jgi:hypothetical protein